MEPIIIAAFAGGLVLVGAMVWKHVLCERARHRRKLRKAPRLPIAEVKEGQLAKVAGTLRLAEEPALEAPLSGRPCAFFEVEVEERQSSGKSSHWVTIIKEYESQQRIFVEDETGKALVTLMAPEVVLTMDAHYESGFLNDASPRLTAFLMRHGHSSEGWVFNKTIRYKEGVLEPGELVAVLGRGSWEPDPDPPPGGGASAGYRDMPMRLHVREAIEDDRMLMSDDPSTLD